MSVVTNLLLTHRERGGDAARAPRELNAWLNANGQHGFMDVGEGICGRKHFEATLLGTATNYLNLHAFFEAAAALPWQYPQWVQVFFREQEAATFGVWTPKQGIVLPSQEF